MSPYDLIFFDCDSTLSRIEGIDELGRRAGVGDRLAALTNRAMNGEIPLESVYGERLDLVRPSAEDLRWLGELYVETLVDGTRELVAGLQSLGKRVVIVSGGILQAVQRLAVELDVDTANVHAVPVILDSQGEYTSFVSSHPLARGGGKPQVCRSVITESGGRSAFIGDGNTDLEAAAVCTTVIGFGGVVAREKVRAQADHFVEESRLDAVAPLLLNQDERERLSSQGIVLPPR